MSRPPRRRNSGWIKSFGLTALLAIVVGTGSGPVAVRAPGDGAGPRVRVGMTAGPYFVGQSVDLAVEVVAGAAPPEVDPPQVTGAVVARLGMVARPIATSGIGRMVSERVQYQAQYRVVPTKPGTLELRPVRVRLGSKSGTSQVLRREVRVPPAMGRPKGFLGGVGPLTIRAEVAPAAVRVGQSVTYRVILEGPGAAGAKLGRPDLSRLERLPIAPRVEPEAVEVSGDLLRRVFPYRVRPTRPGEVVLPPVPVATFDPDSGRYLTRVAPGVRLRVVAVEAFDASSLEYEGPPPPPAAGHPPAWIGPGVGVLGLALAVAALRGVAARRARRRPPAWRVAWRLRKGLEGVGSSPEGGRRIVEALAEFLQVAVDRPPGVLTPVEARRGIAAWTGSAELAGRAEALVAACDGWLYSGRGVGSADLGAEARRLLEDLERCAGRRGRRSRK